MRKLLSAAIFLQTALACTTSSAGELSQALAHIQSLDQSGRKAEAFDAMNAMVLDYYQSFPLQITAAIFSKGNATSFGGYEEFEGDTFHNGDTIYLYAEPLGVKWVPMPDGQFKADLTVGVRVSSSADVVIKDHPDFGRITKVLRHPTASYYLSISLAEIRLPVGRYKVDYTFTDMGTNESVTVTKAFGIQ